MAQAPKPSTMQHPPSTKFKDMTRKQKFVWVLKVMVCVISGGMIYPNVMSD
jgi:hypothetical protein